MGHGSWETGVPFVYVMDDGINIGGGPAQVAAARRLLEGQMRALQKAGERGRSRSENDACKSCST